MSELPQPCAVVGVGFLGSRLLAQLPGAFGVEQREGRDGAQPWAEHPQLIFCCQSTRGGDAAAYRRTYLDVVRALPPAKIVFCSALSAADGRGEKHSILRTAEDEVLRRGGVVARLAALYGPGRCELLRRHLAGEPQLAGADSRHLNYLHVEDAVSALLLLASAPSGVYEVCGESLTKGEAYSLLELVTSVPRSPETAPVGRRGASDVQADSSRLFTLGWRPAHTLADFCRHAF